MCFVLWKWRGRRTRGWLGREVGKGNITKTYRKKLKKLKNIKFIPLKHNNQYFLQMLLISLYPKGLKLFGLSSWKKEKKRKNCTIIYEPFITANWCACQYSPEQLLSKQKAPTAVEGSLATFKRSSSVMGHTALSPPSRICPWETTYITPPT